MTLCDITSACALAVVGAWAISCAAPASSARPPACPAGWECATSTCVAGAGPSATPSEIAQRCEDAGR